MAKRNFSEDLKEIIKKYGYDIEKLKYPVKTTKSLREMDVNVLELSKRSSNVLKRGGIETIENLISKYGTMEKIRGAGETTIKEIKTTFLQWWYENIDEDDVKWFWDEFIKLNKTA